MATPKLNSPGLNRKLPMSSMLKFGTTTKNPQPIFGVSNLFGRTRSSRKHQVFFAQTPKTSLPVIRLQSLPVDTTISEAFPQRFHGFHCFTALGFFERSRLRKAKRDVRNPKPGDFCTLSYESKQFWGC